MASIKIAEFEPGSSGVGSDRSANCVTTTDQRYHLFLFNGPFPASFSSFQQLIVNMFIVKFCPKMDSNRGPLVSKATTATVQPKVIPYLVPAI